jgi:hypothetical protein
MGDDVGLNQLEEIKVEIRALKDALRMSDGYRRDLTIAAEQVLLNTPLVKIGKWFLLLAIVTGMAVWIGGSVYGVIQVKSTQDRTDEIVRQVEAKMATRTKEIDDAATAARGEIDKKTNVVIDAAREADRQKTLVREKLAVDQLPDIRQLKEQLHELAQTGGNLNLHSLSLLSGVAVWFGCSLGLRLSR